MNIKEFFETNNIKEDSYNSIADYTHFLTLYAYSYVVGFKDMDISADEHFSNIIITKVFGKEFYLNYSSNWHVKWRKISSKSKKLTKTKLVKIEKEIAILTLQKD